MKSSSVACIETLVPDSPRGSREVDPRWRLAETVAAGSHFARSPLLSRFLLYVVGETIEGREASLTEHRIGVTVFGRPASYRTDVDNIVRNYARQLRRRLADHFAAEGSASPMRIEIPVGGYIPQFPVAQCPLSDESQRTDSQLAAHDVPRKLGLRIAMAAIALAVFAFLAVLLHRNQFAIRSNEGPVRAFWAVVLPRDSITYVVPSDAGFNLIEDMAQHAQPLATYIRGAYDDVPSNRIGPHAAQDLRSQQYTDLVSLQVVALLARRPEFDPQRVLLRFPRDLRIDDLKHANALIIGSASANPWASVGDSVTNFHIALSSDMESAVIVNSHPQKGEQPSYESHWNEPAHETFALIQFLPNLSGSGHLLLVQGLDVAGTEAAAELLFHSGSIAPILRRAQQSDGTFRPFEILVRATSIQSNAENAQILATRIQ